MDFKKLDAYIDNMTHCGIPSTDVEVRLGHEVVYRHSSGHADAAHTKPISSDNLYWIWSCSKVSCCMAGLKLIEEGKMSLDDPVAKYLPELEHLFVKDGDIVRPARTTLLVRHAFTMQSGWDYGASAKLPETVRPKNNVELFAALASVPLNFDPGTRYEYGLSHDIIGALVEKISGKSLGEYLKESFFDPLGMKDTTFHPTPEQTARIADRYDYNNETYTATLEPQMTEGMGGAVELGSGGLVSSVNDYSLLMDALANGGVGATGVRVLKAETVAMCKKNLLEGVSLEDFRRWQGASTYGYGWGLCGRVHMDDKVSLSKSPVGEFGWNGAAASYALADTENRLSIFIAMHVHNCLYAYHVAHNHIKNLAYEALGL